MAQGETDEGPSVMQRTLRWRWWFHLILLALYPIALGVILPSLAGEQQGTLLPETTRGVVLISLGELGIFGLIFFVAWLASRADASQLLLHWRDGTKPVWRGFVYSVLLRMVIAAGILLLAIIAGLSGGLSADLLQRLRPRTEAVVDPQILRASPVYFVLTLTLISFVVAGLREELWRAGILAGLRALWPGHFATRAGGLAAVAIAAAIFGLGHMPQGPGGAIVTALLGFGLGWIMIRHQSIWEAVLAHGFFNATTFLMLYWLSRYPGLFPGE